MIAKISTGGDFAGAARYILRPEALPERIGGNVAGSRAGELAQEYDVARAQRPDIAQPVYHVSLALPEGEKLTNDQWQRISVQWMARMGIDPDDHQYTIVRHANTDHDHVHLLINRISLDGELWQPGRGSYRKAHQVCRALEREYGLQIVRSDRPANQPRISQRERAMWRRTGIPPAKIYINEQIGVVLQEGAKNHREYIAALQERGICAIPRISKAGQLVGYAYQHDSRTIGGAAVGYSLSALGLPAPGEGEILMLRERESALARGTPYDAARALRAAVWDAVIRGTGFPAALERQGWRLDGDTINRNGNVYQISDYIPPERLHAAIDRISTISARDRSRARERAREYASQYPRSRPWGMSIEDTIMIGLIAPQLLLLLLLLAALIALWQVRIQRGIRADIREIYREAVEEAKEGARELQQDIQFAPARAGELKERKEEKEQITQEKPEQKEGELKMYEGSWDDIATALGADRYAATIGEGRDSWRTTDPDSIARARNAGNRVSVEPASSRYRYIILGVNDDQLRRMRADGISPALVTRAERGGYRCVYRLDAAKIDEETASRAWEGMADRYECGYSPWSRSIDVTNVVSVADVTCPVLTDTILHAAMNAERERVKDQDRADPGLGR